MTHRCANPIAVIMTFPHLQMAFTFLLIINKTLLHNGNCPITDPITEMEVAAQNVKKLSQQCNYLGNSKIGY